MCLLCGICSVYYVVYMVHGSAGFIFCPYSVRFTLSICIMLSLQAVASLHFFVNIWFVHHKQIASSCFWCALLLNAKFEISEIFILLIMPRSLGIRTHVGFDRWKLPTFGAVWWWVITALLTGSIVVYLTEFPVH